MRHLPFIMWTMCAEAMYRQLSPCYLTLILWKVKDNIWDVVFSHNLIQLWMFKTDYHVISYYLVSSILNSLIVSGSLSDLPYAPSFLMRAPP
jgi:hypothetical protein